MRRPGQEPPLDARDLGEAQGADCPSSRCRDRELAAEAQRRGVADVDDERNSRRGAKDAEGVLAAEEDHINAPGREFRGRALLQLGASPSQLERPAQAPYIAATVGTHHLEPLDERGECRPRLRRGSAPRKRKVRDGVLAREAREKVEVA